MAAPLEHYALPVQVYGAALVFARVGAFSMLIPGIGETNVPVTIRLAFSLLLAMTLYPIVRAGLPTLPATVDGLVFQLVIEIVIGVAMGAILRLFLATLAVAGEVVSLQTTLAFAQTSNPTEAQPTATIGAFLSLLGITLIFATNLHHVFLGGVVHSYALFPVGHPPPLGDFAQLATRMTAESFALGIELSAPVIVFALVFNVATGFIGRAMPQFQVFFVASPLTVLLGLSVFALSLGVFGLVWLDRFRAFAERLA
jgi:flagellar biosynthetic protein FliR